MRFNEIVEWIAQNGYSSSVIGDFDQEVLGFSSLEKAKTGYLTWVKKAENYEGLLNKENVSHAIVQEGVTTEIPNQIISPNSKELFFDILHHFWGTKLTSGVIGTGTYISPKTKFDSSVCVGHNCTIDGNVYIGENTCIENNVVIQGNVHIGSNCIIHSGAIVGCDGFGYYFEDNGNMGKVEHFGGVIIEDNVEIGSNSCIDRGTLDDTVIGKNSKIDNLVHVAHNVQIGNNVCVVAGAVICGSAKLENGAYVAPGGIVRNQITVKENGFVGLGAVVTEDVEEERVVIGVPAKPARQVRKSDK